MSNKLITNTEFSDAPTLLNDGILPLLDVKLGVAVLDNHKRIITQTALFDAFARPRKGEKRLEGLPSIVGAKNLLPFISEELREVAQPVSYVADGKLKVGYDATLIPEVCEVYIKAQESGVLGDKQEHIATRCKLLVRALAKIGIVALIDEVTEFQLIREHNELTRLLSAYISKDLMKWTERFPRKFYTELFRLYDWEFKYQEGSLRIANPPYVGKFTKQYVYDYMPPEVMEDIKKDNPKNNKGGHNNRFYWYLTQDIGLPHLDQHITKLITVMELSANKDDFKPKFNQIFGEKPKRLGVKKN
ncbi:P63C domain-containing protein [Vibrio splendidus]|uniref:P63C domain-containing protein n=1 Tax=Vibrio splendidus TaxID=29497 RepID=UPI000C822E47|nr:P63C domain-containing protein [Vibrio splendidus]PMH01696.1 hypothetical protein BCU75_09025 [Vibrio splendidus]